MQGETKDVTGVERRHYIVSFPPQISGQYGTESLKTTKDGRILNLTS